MSFFFIYQVSVSIDEAYSSTRYKQKEMPLRKVSIISSLPQTQLLVK